MLVVVLWMLLAQMLMVASVVVTLVVAGVLEMTRLVLFLVVEVRLVMVMGVATMVLLLMMLFACVSPSVVPLFLHLITCREGEYLARAYLCMRTPYAVPACCLVGARVRRAIRHGASHARSCSATRCVLMTRSSPCMRHVRLPQPTHSAGVSAALLPPV